MNIESIKKMVKEAIPSLENQKQIEYLLQTIEVLERQLEEMQKVIDTAVMFLQGNELFIKAEQIKAMVKALKGVETT